MTSQYKPTVFAVEVETEDHWEVKRVSRSLTDMESYARRIYGRYLNLDREVRIVRYDFGMTIPAVDWKWKS